MQSATPSFLRARGRPRQGSARTVDQVGDREQDALLVRRVPRRIRLNDGNQWC